MDINSRAFWSRTWYEEIPYEKYGNPSDQIDDSKSEAEKEVNPVDINVPFGWIE